MSIAGYREGGIALACSHSAPDEMLTLTLVSRKLRVLASENRFWIPIADKMHATYKITDCVMRRVIALCRYHCAATGQIVDYKDKNILVKTRIRNEFVELITSPSKECESLVNFVLDTSTEKGAASSLRKAMEQTLSAYAPELKDLNVVLNVLEQKQKNGFSKDSILNGFSKNSILLNGFSKDSILFSLKQQKFIVLDSTAKEAAKQELLNFYKQIDSAELSETELQDILKVYSACYLNLELDFFIEIEKKYCKHPFALNLLSHLIYPLYEDDKPEKKVLWLEYLEQITLPLIEKVFRKWEYTGQFAFPYYWCKLVENMDGDTSRTLIKKMLPSLANFVQGEQLKKAKQIFEYYFSCVYCADTVVFRNKVYALEFNEKENVLTGSYAEAMYNDRETIYLSDTDAGDEEIMEDVLKATMEVSDTNQPIISSRHDEDTVMTDND